MKIHELKPPTTKSKRRLGRGIGSGRGKTAGRGTKGQNARSGAKISPYFEGGQNPLVHRLPKQKGFSSRREKAQIIHTDQLNQFPSSSKITAKELRASGLIRSSYKPTKLLARGKLAKSVNVEVQSASAKAQDMIKQAKGTLSIVKVAKKVPAKKE